MATSNNISLLSNCKILHAKLLVQLRKTVQVIKAYFYSIENTYTHKLYPYGTNHHANSSTERYKPD